MKTTVEIADQEFIVEYDFDITAHGSPMVGPSLNYPGDPAEPAEFDIEILGLRFRSQAANHPDLEIPKWLEGVLNTHLCERDDINEIVQRADSERGEGDPDLDRE